MNYTKHISVVGVRLLLQLYPKLYLPCCGDVGLWRPERERTLVGQVAGRRGQVVALVTLPGVVRVQFLDRLGVSHPGQRLSHRHEPHVISDKQPKLCDSSTQLFF